MTQIILSIDNHEIRVDPSTTILSAAKSLNIHIPVLCFSNSCQSSAGCMVCAVKETESGQMMAACSSLCAQGMKIDTCSAEVLEFRRKALNLILSEHKGACEAPCHIVCPQSLDIPRLMRLILEGKEKIDFVYDQTICEECNGKCEKVCNRKKLDTQIKIRDLLFHFGTNIKADKKEKSANKYNHLFGKLSQDELLELNRNSGCLKKVSDLQEEALRCLQCACSVKSSCELRDLADEYQAHQMTYKAEKKNEFQKILAGKIVFQPSKCIRCGRCVSLGKKLNPGKGPVMAYRSQSSMITPPIGMDYEQAFAGFEKEFVEECPTGAIDWIHRYDE